MRILMISSYVPYPLHSGGQVRLFNLIRELSERHEITLIAEKRSKQVLGDISELEKICKKLIIVPSEKQWSIKNIAKAATSIHSFLITGHTNPVLQQRIREELESNKFDLVHVETFYVLQNLPKTFLLKSSELSDFVPLLRLSPLKGERAAIPRLPVVVAEHNIEYSVYERFKKRVPVPLQPLLALDIAKIKREEEEAWRRADRLIAVSEEDKKVMETAGFQAEIVANGVNTDAFRFKGVHDRRIFGGRAEREAKILFIGDFKWIQNQDTAAWIVKEIWPKIRSRVKVQSSKLAVKLWIVGRAIPDAIKRLTDDPDVVFDEKSAAKSTPEIFQEAVVLLAPIRVGGGTSYKILESMACGTPVVTMKLSASAIGAVDGKDLFAASTPGEIAKKTLLILQHKDVYEAISSNARKLIEVKYTWRSIVKELERVYREVTGK